MTTKTYDILGIEVDAMTGDEAAGLIVNEAKNSKSPARYVIKPYVEYFDLANRDEEIRRLFAGAWLSLPEAVSIQWAATYLSGPRTWWRVVTLGAQIVFNPRALSKFIPEKLGGANFTWKLLEECAQSGLRVYLIGTPVDSNIHATRGAIKKRLPNLDIVGTWEGSLGGLSGQKLRTALRNEPIEMELLADLQNKKPDIILVGMGMPLQEELMSKLTQQLPHGIFIGEGGTFDYDSFGGKCLKAPRIFQNAGIEWLWRLMLEPKRIKRQLAIPRFIWWVYRSK